MYFARAISERGISFQWLPTDWLPTWQEKDTSQLVRLGHAFAVVAVFAGMFCHGVYADESELCPSVPQVILYWKGLILLGGLWMARIGFGIARGADRPGALRKFAMGNAAASVMWNVFGIFVLISFASGQGGRCADVLTVVVLFVLLSYVISMVVWGVVGALDSFIPESGRYTAVGEDASEHESGDYMIGVPADVVGQPREDVFGDDEFTLSTACPVASSPRSSCSSQHA
mmetsp:Transcript_1911/g.4303  ORF Transcript_1911/g.4303 Transcript_1911/m.4303 type:complete len:230 (+) Transcript_1911:30-719(+)